MKVYYAHSMHLYNTEQEKRDVQLLEALGMEVVNPNSPKISAGVEEFKEKYGKTGVMGFFDAIINECDALAYRSHVDGKIPSGVGYEIKYAGSIAIPIFELPTLIKERFLDYEDTKAYLEYNGNR